MMRRFVMAVGLAAVVASACGGGTDTTVGPGPAEGGAVTIDGFAFAPAELTVSVGDSVTWTNEQGVTHTVTADDGSFDSGNVASGDDFSHTFDTAGTFAYHCSIHTTMTAAVTVQ